MGLVLGLDEVNKNTGAKQGGRQLKGGKPKSDTACDFIDTFSSDGR